MMNVNQIICGNCLEVMSNWPDECIDLSVTSPPYDNLRTYQGYQFEFEDIAKQLFRIIKPGGILVWVVADGIVNGSETLTSFKQAIYFKDIGFNIHDTMIYSKSGFSRPSSNRYHQTHEYMFIISRGKPKTFNPIKDRVNKYKTCWGKNTIRQVDGSMVETRKSVNSEYGMRFNVWNLNTAGQENPCQSNPHPAQFPYQLALDHIYSWSNEGDIVLDPFVGSGTTCLAAIELNRKYVGIDISQEYCELARDRIKTATDQITLFE